MIRFHDYYGNEVYIVPARVLFVRDGGCGSRGAVAEVHLDNGKIISLGDTAERVQREIDDAMRPALPHEAVEAAIQDALSDGVLDGIAQALRERLLAVQASGSAAPTPAPLPPALPPGRRRN